MLYVNDLITLCPGAKNVLLADDTTILIGGTNIAHLIKFSSVIYYDYSYWFADNKLALNCKELLHTFS